MESYLSYLAGILDGEGSIMVKKTTYRRRSERWRDMISPEYFARVSVKNANEEVIGLFEENFGGRKWQDKRPYPSKGGFRTNKRMWCYESTCRQATNLVERLLPYLRIKKPQAEKIIELREAKKRARVSPRKKDETGFHGKPYRDETVAEFERIYQEVKRLNGH